MDKVGDAYGVSVDIVNPTDGVLLASVSEPPMPQSELLRAIGRVAIAVRARLGEGLPSVEASRLALAKVTTPSLKALYLFSQAVARQDEEGTFGGRARAAVAEQLLRAALAEDPGFASAHMLLSIAIRGPAPERLAEAVEHVKQGIALSDGVTELERLVNEAELGIQWAVSTDLAERKRWQEYAIAKYEAVLQLQPNHTQALVCLTNLYAEIGQPNARVAMQLAELRPHSSRWAAQAASAALLAGNFDAARTYAHRELAFAVTPAGVISEAWIRLFDAYDAWLRNDVRAALAVADRVAEEFDRSRGTRASTPPNPDTGFARQLSSLYLILGRFERARAYAARMEPAARKLRSLDIAQHSENVELQKAVLALEYPRLEDSTNVINALIESGEIGKARLARDLFAKRANHSPAYLAFIDGQLAFVDGRLDEAIDKIGIYLRNHLPGRGHSVADKLAVALAAKGETARAIALLESFSHRASLVGSPAADRAYHRLPLRERLALLYRQVGRHRDADAIEAELRALLAVADDDHPIKQRLQQTASARGAR